MRKRLFIPGPVEVRSDVLERMASPMIGHRTTEASDLQHRIADKLRTIMYTTNEILLSTSSGSGLMEGAVRSCTAKRAAVFSIGAFGDRWFRMCTANGIPADLFSSELGQPTTAEAVDNALSTGRYDLVTITHNETATGVANSLDEFSPVFRRYPEVIVCVDAVSSLGGHRIETDRAGIDICITSSQKCLGLPPGLALASVSDKAYQAAKKVKNRGLYFDYVELYEFVRDKNNQYPSTPSLSHMFALDYQLDRILEEGLERRFARHAAMAETVRAWARERFALYSNERYLSNTVTCVDNTRGIPFSRLSAGLGERGYAISDGYAALKGRTFRIAHMADATLDEVSVLLDEIDRIVG
ncbi:MAG: alanine--glyoxylate aminotransferase family protein [Clostridia bacterium]|nr:alanine--glyoxylate aminotransferase family protein [Clostridia bacterium]